MYPLDVTFSSCPNFFLPLLPHPTSLSKSLSLSLSLALYLAPSSPLPPRPVWLTAPLRWDGGHCSPGAGWADQRPPASWRRAIHGAGHGPAGWTAGRPAQEPHPRGQGQCRSEPHQGTVSKSIYAVRLLRSESRSRTEVLITVRDRESNGVREKERRQGDWSGKFFFGLVLSVRGWGGFCTLSLIKKYTSFCQFTDENLLLLDNTLISLRGSV